MKKTMKLFWLLAASAVVFSCSKESVHEDETPVNSSDEPAVVTPVTPATDGNLLTSFGVTFENDPESKVSVDIGSGVTTIEENDEVLVFVDKDDYATYKYDGSKFVIKEGENAVTLSSTVSVYYPRNEFDIYNDAVVFVMPDGIEASGDFGAINPMAGVIAGTSGSYTVELKNLASVLKVHVTAEVNINSVTLDYSSGIYYAKGCKFYVDATETTMTYASDHEGNSSETITITPSTTADVLFLIPTVGLPSGLSVTANLAANHNGGANTFTVTNPSTNARARNSISTMSFKAKLFDGGLGTSESPYLISSAKDFKYIQKYTTEGYTPGVKDAAHFLSAHYLQTADIDFKGASLTPIGVYNSSAADRKPFNGSYNGKNIDTQYSLSNFVIESESQGVGLFSAVEGASLLNISIANPQVTVNNNSYVGSLVGWLNGGTVSECTISGGFVKSSGGATGGLVGYVYGGGTISNCTLSDINVGPAASPSGNNYGGIIGYVRNSGVLKISGCTVVSGSVSSGNSYGQVGGIIGSSQIQGLNDLDSQYLYVSNCTNHATIKPGSRGYSGGIIGIMNGGTITGCKNYGSIEGNRDYAGGIAGYVPSVNTSSITGKGSEIINCLSSAQVKGNNKVGGIVGFLGWGVIQCCTAKGSVTGAQCVGGIVGEAQAGVTTNGGDNGNARILLLDCLAKASVSTTKGTEAYTGGVIGYLHSSYANKSAAFATIGSCVGWNSSVNNTSNEGCSYLGGFVGYVSTQVANNANNNRVRMFYCYTIVEPSSGSISSAPSKFGGFVGFLERGSANTCYYTKDTGFQDATASSNNVFIDNLAQKGVSEISFTEAQKLSNQNISNGRGSYYNSSAWTSMGKNSEALIAPLPSALVALGEEYYN